MLIFNTLQILFVNSLLLNNFMMIYKSVKSKSWIARLWGIFLTPMITYLKNGPRSHWCEKA